MEDDEDYLPDFLKDDSDVESPFSLDDMVMPSDYEWTYLNDDYSVESILKLNKEGKNQGLNLTGNQMWALDKIKDNLYNWDNEPGFSDIFHKEFCKKYGISLSILKALEKKGLIKLSKDDYYFKEQGYIVYPKPLMYLVYISNQDYPDWFIPEAKEKGLWKAESFEAEGDECSNCGVVMGEDYQAVDCCGTTVCDKCVAWAFSVEGGKWDDLVIHGIQPSSEEKKVWDKLQSDGDVFCHKCLEKIIPNAYESHRAESKKMNPLEKAGISGVASGATMEGLETLMAAEDFMGFEYYFLVDTDGKVTNDFSSLEDAQIALSYVPNRNLKIMRRRFEGKNMAGTTTEVTEFDPYKTPNYFKNNYHSEGTLEPCPHDAGIDSEEVSWLGEGDRVVHITGRCPDCSAEGEGYVQIDFEEGERYHSEGEEPPEEELSEKQLRDYFALLKAQNPDLARKIEFSVKNEEYLPTEEIEEAGFQGDKIEEWVELIGVEDDNLQPYESCSNCEGEGWILTSYTPATRYDPADGDGEDCEECVGTGMIDPADYMDKEGQYYAETFEARYGGSNCGKCGGDHSGYCPDYGEDEYIHCPDCKWDGANGNWNTVIEWCSSCKEKNEIEAKRNAERIRLEKERDEQEERDYIESEKYNREMADIWEDRYFAEEKSITPYLLGVGIVGILGYAFIRKL